LPSYSTDGPSESTVYQCVKRGLIAAPSFYENAFAANRCRRTGSDGGAELRYQSSQNALIRAFSTDPASRTLGAVPDQSARRILACT
jgi:hypothetical protein